MITIKTTESGAAEYNGTPAELHALFTRATAITYGSSTSTDLVGHARDAQVFLMESGTVGITATDHSGGRVTFYRSLLSYGDLCWIVAQPPAE